MTAQDSKTGYITSTRLELLAALSSLLAFALTTEDTDENSGGDDDNSD